MSIHRLKSIVLASVAALAAPAAASAAGPGAVPAASVQAVSLPTAGSVTALYDQYKLKPIWFRNGGPSVAVTQLTQILKRAPLDGLGSGPQLAGQIEAAVAQATASKSEADIATAEQLLSSSWVLYVQTIKRPTPGMIYAYDVLKPQGTRTDQILLAAQSAPSLEQHIASVAAVNPIYSSIRDAEWARIQATGEAPDPRVLMNLERVRSIPSRGRFVLVDAGSQRLFMYENGVPVDSMKVIVGMKKLPTPMMASVMYYITYNPYWNAPDHLVREQIARKTLAGGMKYFKGKMGYQVMADWTANSATIPAESVDWKAVQAGKTHVRIRQDPGPENFMGILKFPFPNPEDIYLHDTPAKGHFNDANRAQSNGCIRLEDATRFGRWLLGGRDPTPPGPDPEIQVQLQQPVPIYVTYITAQPTPEGLTFLKDEYGWDQPGAAQMAAAEMAASRVPRD